MNSQSAAFDPRERLIVALDFPTQSDAMRTVEALGDSIRFFKIGLQLYTAAGPEIVRAVAATAAKVFLDLKLHDIPNTVGRTVTTAGHLGVQMLTLHLSGGAAMIEAAIAARAPHVMLLGVTVLTSFDRNTLQQTGVGSPIAEQVQRLAKLGVSRGIDGLVASPHEIKMLRDCFGQNIKVVTPGVRPRGSEAGDQKRFMTPREALQAGADYLIVGRPITAEANPRDAALQILEEISA